MKSKRTDYSSKEDALSNFKQVAAIVGITPEQVCLVLIAVKASRLGNLFIQNLDPQNESIEDSAKDLTIYTMLLQMILQDHLQNIIKTAQSDL